MICFVTLFLEVLSRSGNVFWKHTIIEKWSIQLCIQNFYDECYECTLCLFWQNMHEHKKKYFHLNSIDIYTDIVSLGNPDPWVIQAIFRPTSPLPWPWWSRIIWSWSWSPQGNLREIVLWDGWHGWSMKTQPLFVYRLYNRNVISWVLQVPLSFILPLYWSDKISCGPLRKECQHSYVLFWSLWLLGREEVLEL